MAKKSKSPLVQRQKDLEKGDFSAYNMTPEEAEQYTLIIDRIVRAREGREAARDEFDGMTYEQAYLSNKRAAMSYLTPKRNDDEVRVVTGTTEKRVELVLNELLGLNIESEIRAFDRDDNLLMDVGDIFTDVVKRTRQIEAHEDKRVYYYKELLTQPSVFVEELWLKQRQGRGFKTRNRCETRMIQGIQVYLGDSNLPDVRFNEQPYIVKYARMSLSEGEGLFKDLNPEKWKKVKEGPYQSIGATVNDKLYRPGSLTDNEIEAFWYMSYPDDELQIIVQGIPMLEVGSSYIEEYGDFDGYHITMVGLQPYGWDFAYSKPLTQSAKTLQALDNETIRNLIRKFRQALEPPMGVKGGKMFNRDIWNPGAITYGITKNDFEKLVDHGGVTRSEMSMFDLIEKKVNEFIGTSQSEPLQNKSQVTATELTLAQKNAVKMLGSAVLAVTRLEDRLAMLRVKNVKNNYTKPVGKNVDPVTKKINDVYARFSLENVDLGDRQGTKIIQMTDRGLTREEQELLFREEEKAKKVGKPFQYKTVNVKALEDLDMYFFASSSSRPLDNSELDKAMMTEMINQGQGIANITGRKINANKIIEKFERTYKEKDFFEKEAPQQMGPAMPQGSPMGGSPDDTVNKGTMGQRMEEMMDGNKLNQMGKGMM